MHASDIMTSSPTCCLPEASLRDAARMMVEHDCGEIPVVDSLETRKILGVVTDRDIVIRIVAKGRNPLELAVRDCMTQPAVTIASNCLLQDCLRLMEQHQIRRLPVVDSAGQCIGIISQADIARRMDQEAAEVVREVSQPKR